MRRGRVAEDRLSLQDTIVETIEAQGVLPRLAKRIAFQLVLKFDAPELGDRTLWSAIGRRLQRESARLETHVTADPVSTAYRLLENFENVVELATKTHPWVARTIALSACRAANPFGTARTTRSCA